MKLKKLALIIVSFTLAAAFAGCGAQGSASASSQAPASSASSGESGVSGSEAASSTVSEPVSASSAAGEKVKMNLAALKGPTSMGMVKLLADNEAGLTGNDYAFTMSGTADEIVARISKGELDVAAVPCNLASVLYNKTEGKISVAAINTLGVLYIVENGDTVQSVADLKGKTLYATGKGTPPQYSLDYILRQNGLDPEKDLTIEYKSEATELASALSEGTATLALLPEPYVTTVKTKNAQLRTALDLTEQWDKLESGSSFVTGVVIVRNAFLQENKAAFDQFLEEYKASADYVNGNTAEAAALVGKYEIAPAAVAEKALPNCSITFIEGSAMKEKVGGYLKVLFDQDPKSVGGKLPDDAFYYQR